MSKLIKALFAGNKDQVEKLLVSGDDINFQDKDKRTLLIHAVIDNKLEIVEKLILRGADLNLQDSLGYSALHYAAQNYFLDAVELLLKNESKVDVQDIHGNTPLFRAVFNSRGRGEVIKILLANGADKELKNNHGVSPQQLAITIGNYNISQFLE